MMISKAIVYGAIIMSIRIKTFEICKMRDKVFIN